MAPGDEGVDRLAVALEGAADRATVLVAYPPAHTEATGLVSTACTEEHALDETGHGDVDGPGALWSHGAIMPAAVDPRPPQVTLCRNSSASALMAALSAMSRHG